MLNARYDPRIIIEMFSSDGLTQLANTHMQCAFKHWFKVLRSSNLGLKEKIDGLLLLNVYSVCGFWVVLAGF